MERRAWLAALGELNGVVIDMMGDSAEIEIGVFCYWNSGLVTIESEICCQNVEDPASIEPIVRTHLLAVRAARTKGVKPQ